MPLTKVQRRLVLGESPYLKHFEEELDEETIFLGDATNPSQSTESADMLMFRSMRNIPRKFHGYMCMSVDTFDLLLSKIASKVVGTRTNFGPPPIPAELRLILTLRYLISGESHRSLSRRFRVGRITSADIFNEVSSAICEVLFDEYVPRPTQERWHTIADNFYRKTGFPNCLGILQGVNMTSPIRNSPPRPPSLSQFLSIFMETVIDDNEFIVTSNIQHMLQNRSMVRTFCLSEGVSRWKMNLPQSKVLPKSKTEAPCVLLTDNQFPDTVHILKPAPHRRENEILNLEIELAKKNPEDIFKKMMTRFLILKKPMTCNVEVARTLLQAICVLHNFILTHDGPGMLDGLPDPGKAWQGVKFMVIDGNYPELDEEASQVKQTFQDFFERQDKLTTRRTI